MRNPQTLKRVFRWSVLLCILVLSAVTLLAAKQDSKKNAAQEDPKPAQDQSQFVGSDTCKGCHEEQGKTIDASPHYRTNFNKIRGEKVHGCESCHGPGAAHVAGGGDKTKIFDFKTATSEDISKRCLTCHEANPEQSQFLRSVHNTNDVNCLSCHSVHHSKQEYLLVKQQPALCFTCHVEQRADFQKPFRHRVLEGLVKCSDCHNAHGTLAARQLRTSTNQDFVCFKCHSDKRGPFVFEHQPVKTEGCVVCHTPHGSTNPRMLVTARVNSLCLQCHELIPTGPHPVNAKAQACIMCHSQIHGSNTDERFFR